MERRLKDRFPPKFEAECTKRVPSALFFPIFSRAREKIGPPEAPAAANLQQSIPQARSLCHYWYASSLYTREPLKRTARSTAEMWNNLSVSLGADSSPGRGAFLCAKQRAEGGCGGAGGEGDGEVDEMGALVIAEHVRADHAFELGVKVGKEIRAAEQHTVEERDIVNLHGIEHEQKTVRRMPQSRTGS